MEINELTARLEAFKAKRIQEAKAEGRQKYPSSKIKASAILFKVDVCTYDDGKTEIEIHEWHIRSIKKKRGSQTRHGFVQRGAEYNNDKFVHATAKIKHLTWVRKSRKVNDYGWNTYIPAAWKVSFRVGDYLPLGMHTTVAAALRSAIRQKKEQVSQWKKWQEDETTIEDKEEWDEDIRYAEKELKLLKVRLTKLKNKTCKK